MASSRKRLRARVGVWAAALAVLGGGAIGVQGAMAAENVPVTPSGLGNQANAGLCTSGTGVCDGLGAVTSGRQGGAAYRLADGVVERQYSGGTVSAQHGIGRAVRHGSGLHHAEGTAGGGGIRAQDGTGPHHAEVAQGDVSSPQGTGGGGAGHGSRDGSRVGRHDGTGPRSASGDCDGTGRLDRS